jgi:hypothetical protein
MTRTLPILLTVALLAPVYSQKASNPLVGSWNFDMPGGSRAVWLGVKEIAGGLEIWYQPTGGNVYQVKNFKADGRHLSLALSAGSAKRPALSWEVDVDGDKITAVEKRGDATTTLIGTRAPQLKRSVPTAWTNPEPLFNGKNLDGWEPIGDPANSKWVARDGMLVNDGHGANLKTTRKFDDLKVHFEVNCPEDGNSGFYLRGRYEVQIEYEKVSANPPERRIGSIYGRITPKEMPRTPGQWETFDITLVNRAVTVVRNGVTVIDRAEIEGITGGALDSREAEPGPFYIQGDHTGGLKFRNVTVSVPKR